MKNLYTICMALILTFPLMGKALMPHSPVASAEIIRFKFDPNSNLSQYQIQIGNIVVEENQLTLNLAEVRNCPPNKMCPAVMPVAFTYTAKIIAKTESCGSVYFKAVRDLMPADGTKVEIIVADHSRRTCRNLVPYITEIRMEESFYDRQHGTLITHKHYFGANKFFFWNF